MKGSRRKQKIYKSTNINVQGGIHLFIYLFIKVIVVVVVVVYLSNPG